jgi:hypothetical protein
VGSLLGGYLRRTRLASSAILFGAPLPFYITTFRIMGLREYSVALVSRIKDVMASSNKMPEVAERKPSWEKQRTVAIVTDCTNVKSKARRDMLTEGMFSFVYGCAAHAMSNLTKDLLKMPNASRALSFFVSLTKFLP